GVRQVLLGDRADGMPVRDAEEAEGADQQVHVEGADIRAEYPGGAPAVQDLLDGRYGAHVDSADGRELLQMLGVMDVLHRNQPDEARMALVVVEGDLDEPSQSFQGRQLLQVRLALTRADAVVRLLEHRAIQSVLAAEVVIEHALRGARTLRDRIYAGPGEAVFGEFLHGHGYDVRLGSLRVGEILQRLPFCLCALLGRHGLRMIPQPGARLDAGRAGSGPGKVLRAEVAADEAKRCPGGGEVPLGRLQA